MIFNWNMPQVFGINQKLGVIKEDYLETIEDGYDAEGHHGRFFPKGKNKALMDKWVSDKTHQMIKKLDTELSGEARCWCYWMLSI
jgi:serine protease inhibitor